MLAPKAAHVLGLTAFERPITEVGGLQGEWLEYATVDSCWLFKSCTILQFIFKGALLANTSIIILPLHRRLHQWLQSLFCVVGFFTTISLDFTSAGFHLSTDPPFPHPFGLGLHEYSPFRCISPCLGSRCSRPEKQKKHIGCGWCGLHNHKMYIYIYVYMWSGPWHAEYDYYFSTASSLRTCSDSIRQNPSWAYFLMMVDLFPWSICAFVCAYRIKCYL